MVISEGAVTLLENLLKEHKLCVWPVTPMCQEFSDGWRFGVTLPWPMKDSDGRTDKECFELVVKITREIASLNGKKPLLTEPGLAAGGALAMYCGFVPAP